MSTYDDASLIMFPSGYKEDKIYSLKPTDGSGDLTFTRASTATRVNSDGLIETSPVNLCEYSEDQTQWTSQNATTVTANSTTAPNGTLTADTVTPSTANTDHYRGIILSPQVGALTAFIYVKPNGYNFFDWGIYNGSQYIVRATFDLVNLTYTFTDAGTATIESVGNGWLKCGISGTNASLSTMSLYYRSRPTGGSSGFTGDGTSGAFIWGAQVNIGSTAKTYFPTTDRLDVPRIDYTGGGCGKLLLESQRTNLVTYSEQIDNAAWTKTGVTISANATTSPDGTNNADKIIGNASAGDKIAFQVKTITTGQAFTISAFYKKSEYKLAFLRAGGQTDSPYVIYNLDTQAVVSTSGASSTKIEDYSNGWYRVSLTLNSATSATCTPNLSFAPDSGYTLSGLNVPQYTGDGTSGGFIWGCQLEANGAAYATSYIPTLASSVTRLADTASKTGISSLINSTEGVLFVEISSLTTTESGIERYVSISNGSTSNSIRLGFNGNTNAIYARIFIAGTAYTPIINTSSTITNFNKLAVKWKVDDFALWINGVEIASVTTSANIFGSGQLTDIKFNRGDGAEPFYGKVQNLMVFPSALSDNQLADLTGGNKTTFNALAEFYGYTIL